ncbi:MAG TPA: hypothetical protein VFB89_11375 [Gemmatimonadales bacterium]|nr:hypothetical protein [Gemmatimonadales bacterium]
MTHLLTSADGATPLITGLLGRSTTVSQRGWEFSPPGRANEKELEVSSCGSLPWEAIQGLSLGVLLAVAAGHPDGRFSEPATLGATVRPEVREEDAAASVRAERHGLGGPGAAAERHLRPVPTAVVRPFASPNYGTSRSDGARLQLWVAKTFRTSGAAKPR